MAGGHIRTGVALALQRIHPVRSLGIPLFGHLWIRLHHRNDADSFIQIRVNFQRWIILKLAFQPDQVDTHPSCSSLVSRCEVTNLYEIIVGLAHSVRYMLVGNSTMISMIFCIFLFAEMARRKRSRRAVLLLKPRIRN